MIGAAALGAPLAAEVATARSAPKLQAALAVQGELSEVYRAREWRPIWIADGALRPEATQVLELLRSAARDGLDPLAYSPERLEAALLAARRDPSTLPEAERLLSESLVAYVRDLRTPTPAARLRYTDNALQPAPLTAAAIMDQVTTAPSLRDGIHAATRMNPVYEGLRSALANAKAEDRDLIRLNLERARALPQDLGQRYVLVDVAAQRLWWYQNGAVQGSMKVVVGKPSMATPAIAGLIRFAVYNPYWNLPQDLVRERAATVLRRGVGAFTGERMEALSDWTPSATRLDPSAIDWESVASGRQPLRVRQIPGPDNTMGAVKLMLPNELGIYLHDTPQRWAFQRQRRTMSSGCVRLEDAHTLARWLLGGDPYVTGAAEQRIDLPEPVPVYITYFTAAAHDGVLQKSADLYGRDALVTAELADGREVRLAVLKGTTGLH